MTVLDFPPNGEPIRLVFSSDNHVSRPGFEIRVDQVLNSCYTRAPSQPSPPAQDTSVSFNDSPYRPRLCAGASSLETVFQSENYPLVYPPDTYCVYKVYRAHRYVCRIEIYLVDFNVGRNDGGFCLDDFVEIAGVRYCGHKTGQRIEIDFPTSTDVVNFHFRSTPSSIVSNGGFRMTIRQLDNQCRVPPPPAPPTILDPLPQPPPPKPIATPPLDNGPSIMGSDVCNGKVFTESTFQVLSPGYLRGVYRPYETCIYTIRKSTFDVCAIEVKYNQFSLENSEGCHKDYLQINDLRVCGKLPYDATSKYQWFICFDCSCLGWLVEVDIDEIDVVDDVILILINGILDCCYCWHIGTYEFLDDEMQIKFVTDRTVQDIGFFITIKQVRC